MVYTPGSEAMWTKLAEAREQEEMGAERSEFLCSQHDLSHGGTSRPPRNKGGLQALTSKLLVCIARPQSGTWTDFWEARQGPC